MHILELGISYLSLVKTKLLSIFFKSGNLESFSCMIGLSIGHVMFISVSFHMIPFSSSGEYSWLTLYNTSASSLNIQKPCANPSGI